MTTKKGRLQTKMVDVGGKADTQRTATARGVVRLRADVAQMILDGRIPKGNVLEVARVAGIMAAKNTPRIIPLCHPLIITNVEVDFQFEDRGSKIEDRRTNVLVTATVRCVGKTGVEMEALTAVSAAALTIYDMCKTVQKDIEITDIYLLTKSGGKSGVYRRKKE